MLCSHHIFKTFNSTSVNLYKNGGYAKLQNLKHTKNVIQG